METQKIAVEKGGENSNITTVVDGAPYGGLATMDLISTDEKNATLSFHFHDGSTRRFKTSGFVLRVEGTEIVEDEKTDAKAAAKPTVTKAVATGTEKYGTIGETETK